MKKRKRYLYFSLIISLLFIISGIILVVCSFRTEVLDGKYIVINSTNYKSEKHELKKGEFNITKDVLYISDGKYKIVYNINYNSEDKKILFDSKSKVTMTDIFGDGYKLDTDRIIINNDPIKLYSYNTVTSNYTMSYENNTFEISFPSNKLFKHKTITLYITLTDRNTNTKYVTSKESYYSFKPNVKNDFYIKKTMQSYVIDGYGYIILNNKKK